MHFENVGHLFLLGQTVSFTPFRSQAFRGDLWLSQTPLNRATVLDYFALSKFYDRDCVNELAVETGKSRADSGCVRERTFSLCFQAAAASPYIVTVLTHPCVK